MAENHSSNKVEVKWDRFSVKWDTDVDRVKHLFKDLGVNFLPLKSKTNDNKLELSQLRNTSAAIKCSAFDHNQCLQQTTDAKTDQRSINHLSDELLLKIFQYLPIRSLLRCRQVSKQWSRISSDSCLWKFIDLSKYTMSYSDVENIVRCGVSGVLLFGTRIVDNLLDNNYDRFNCIEYLDLSLADISVQLINALLDSNANQLSLKKLSLDSLCVDNTTLDLIVTKHKRLQVLNMSMCSSHSEQLVFKQSLPQQLTELNISGIVSLNIDQLWPVLPESLIRLNVSVLKMLDEHVESLVSVCPKLIELDVSECNQLTNHSLGCIAEGLRCLEIFHIHSTFGFTNISLLETMPNLRTVSVHRNLANLAEHISSRRYLISTIARPNTNYSNKIRPTIWGITLLV